MNTHPASVSAILSTLLLSDHRVLHAAWKNPFMQPLDWSALREPTYLANQAWAARFPDHVFNAAWSGLTSRPNNGSAVLLPVLQSLVEEFLEPRHGEVRIRNELVGAWQQSIASRLSCLPIQAAAVAHFGGQHFMRTHAKPNPWRTAPSSWEGQTVPLLRPEAAPVADYIQREGLHETHLHLNGSTHAEICWLRALHNNHAETRDFNAAWTKKTPDNPIRELVAQVNPALTPSLFAQYLRTAQRLRTWLMSAAENRVAHDANFPLSCESLYSADANSWSTGLHNVPNPAPQQQPDIQEERTWITTLLADLQQKPNVQLAQMLHAYLLLLNGYYRLLVQSETQYGFDQFQKFTKTGLREPSEKDYSSRFYSMHGTNPKTSTVGYLEARFAPKQDALKAQKLFQSILGGYLDYLCSATQTPRALGSRTSLNALLSALEQHFTSGHLQHRSVQRLALVAHFIKKEWKPQSGPFRHYSLDKELRDTANLLLSMLARWPRLGTWVRGIDAAANELHAPPDVFAAVYRVCAKAGLTRRSFHAGEDFRHLLSGIAAIWDALELLDLRNGDRIGHGTAMGIDPRFWLGRMPKTLRLPQGEWLLAVLAAWQLLRDLPEMQACSNKLQHELEKVAHAIFKRTVSALEIERAMQLRGLSRRDLMQQIEGDVYAPNASLNDAWQPEFQRVAQAREEQPEATALLWEWLSNPSVIEKSNQFTDRDSDFLDAPSYIKLQQALMKKVADRGVLIETLPSSNVRISQYQHINEHHALRWMRIPGHLMEGDPEIMVCLGSDDPGIFASDLETEFYLMYTTLKEAGLDDSTALDRLSVLNERGRVYRFHDPMLS